jgi:hypothetical protein
MYSYYGSGSNSTFWEWDPVSAGWSMRTTSDYLDYGAPYCASYDSTRRREVIFGDVWGQMTGIHETWELDAKGPTWYVRSIVDSPTAGYGTAMAFDSTRGVVVLFGGNANGIPMDETWEYSVTGLGNGEGCSASTAASCASGNCVDGVCCESASCTGPTKAAAFSPKPAPKFLAVVRADKPVTPQETARPTMVKPVAVAAHAPRASVWTACVATVPAMARAFPATRPGLSESAALTHSGPIQRRNAARALELASPLVTESEHAPSHRTERAVVLA